MMTEQPPSAEALEASEEFRLHTQAHTYQKQACWAKGSGFALVLAAAFDRFAERVCEQRVSAAVDAERERCFFATLLRKGETWSQDALWAADEIRKRMVAPAERPAPEGPQLSSEAWAYLAGLGGYGPTDVEEAVRMYPQQDSLRGIGVEQPTQEARQPGCGTKARPRHIYECTTRAGCKRKAGADCLACNYGYWEKRAGPGEPHWHFEKLPRPPGPSDLASTGEQPDKEDHGKGSV